MGFLVSQGANELLQAQIDMWNVEYGGFYTSGVGLSFSQLNVKVDDSPWNWARPDALNMYFNTFGRLGLIDREIVSMQCIRIMNRSDAT